MLVTGGLGAIGARVAAALERIGEQVVTVDTGAASEGGEREHRRLDVRDRGALQALMEEFGIERTVHLAARVHDGRQRPRAALEVNVGGTLAVIEATAAAGGRRVVLASSRAVYGEISGPGPAYSAPRIAESHPRRPTNVYGVGKLAAETFGAAAASQLGVEFACVRFGSVFGPGGADGASDAADALRAICEAPLHEGPTRIAGGGDQRDDFVYIEDAARGMSLAVLSGGPGACGAFHISSGRATTLREFAATVRELAPDTDLEVGGGFDPFDLGHDAYAVLDHAKATAAFGYRPDFDLRSALADYLSVARGERV